MIRNGSRNEIVGVSQGLGFDPKIMDSDAESLKNRVEQLEHERDQLRKDIEQLCLQQAGPSYLAVATRMHFQRTAALEQEIDNFKNKLALSTRNNLNLQEELSQVYHIKSQLADLHNAEVSKNMEAEKQLKFFQGCVAAAFAERDNALMEAEKAKERVDVMSHEVNNLRERVEETTSSYLNEKKLHSSLQLDLMKLKEQNEKFQKVISRFYDIRQSFSGVIEDACLDNKCENLLRDAPEMWSFNSDTKCSASEYINALKKELETSKNSVDRHQDKIQMGLEIEDHLKKRILALEKQKILFGDTIKNKISQLHRSHTHVRFEVMGLLEHEKTHLKTMLDVLHERIKSPHENQTRDFGSSEGDAGIIDIECRDVHITTNAEVNLLHEKKDPSSPIIFSEATANTSETLAQALGEKKTVAVSPLNFPEVTGDTSNTFAQALREKVDALLLLSQQDERHLLERNVNAALQKKIEELQRNLQQVTNEKVKTLMELAQLRQDYQHLQENISLGINHGPLVAGVGERSIADHERDGKLKNLLKKTYLKRWISIPDFSVDAPVNNEGNPYNKRSNNPVDIARLRIENATLKESLENMEHLTSSVHRLRQLLLKAKDSTTTSTSLTSTIEVLNNIITEAKLIKTALASSLPISWSVEADTGTFGATLAVEPTDGCGDAGREKLDAVSATGFEMIELLILAAQMLEDNIVKTSAPDES